MSGEYPMADSITESSELLLSSVRRAYSRRSAGLDEAGESPRSAASARAFLQVENTCCAIKRARASDWRRVCRVSRAIYRAETAVTTASTTNETARVNLVLRLRRIDPPRLVFF